MFGFFSETYIRNSISIKNDGEISSINIYFNNDNVKNISIRTLYNKKKRYEILNYIIENKLNITKLYCDVNRKNKQNYQINISIDDINDIDELKELIKIILSEILDDNIIKKILS